MEITNKIFETLLTKNDFKKKEFANYSKTPYDTVVGWKKKGYIPPYAMVILKDMIYRKKLDEETEKLFKRNIHPTTIENYNLTKIEENKLKAVFWGTNFTTDDILKGIREKNQKILKKIEENISKTIIKDISKKINL